MRLQLEDVIQGAGRFEEREFLAENFGREFLEELSKGKF